MKTHLFDFVNAVIADDSEAERKAFGNYIPEKTNSVLRESTTQQDMFTDNVEPVKDATKRFLVKPIGVSYDAPEEAASVAANNQKQNAVVVDTQTNQLLDWKAILKQYAKT